jgi:diaminopropionate ammonia-lyase
MQYYANKLQATELSTSFDFARDEIANRAVAFHQSLPNYQATPCHKLSCLAEHLGIHKLWVKDESQRFDLNAFKILGASYAVAVLLSEWLNLDTNKITFKQIQQHHRRYQHLTLVTATDGNHGRAVAWAAQQFGCAAQVFMPEGTLETRAVAIRDYGAQAEITELNYDDTVRLAAQTANRPDAYLVQDTAWDTYTRIPLIIQQGYFSLISEAFSQIEADEWPTHIFVQAGVGSLPAALAARLRMLGTNRPTPKFVVVEPTLANCLFKSMAENDGNSVSLTGHLPTMMAGLACGTPSSIALAVLRECADGFLCCDDEIAKRGMRVLAKPLGGDQKIISGESGAVTLGAVFELCCEPENAEICQQIGLNKDSQVMLFSTEGDTAPALYRDIVWGK